MKEFTFTAYCNYGKGDSVESWIDVELTDEEAGRLESFGTQAEVFYNGFSQCEELKDIYQKVYSFAVDQMTEELRDYGDLEEQYANDPNWKVDNLYHCGVNFPNVFEEQLVDNGDEDEKVF